MKAEYKIKSMSVKDIAMIGIMAAVLETSKIVLSFLPNIELVSLLIIVYTLNLGFKRTAIIILIFDFVETLIWGIGIWTISYLYVWLILSFVTYCFRNESKKPGSKWTFTIISAIFGLAFGQLCAITTCLVGGLSTAVAWWISGIPYDIAHCIGNAVICYLLFEPVCRMLKKICIKSRIQ